ncbi:MAG: aminoacyl-tRNA hydrolase, partial [Mycoplasmoidaceae bacterium]|nr:aminoacyl-tRNA hydrolase [Mycoplasmoidaceae bacterium]
DVDTEFGKFRIRKSGSSGGQNGLKSIINHLGTEDFKRIRVGIGRPTNNQTMVSHVLAKFNEKEREILQKTLDFASKAVIE